MQAGFAMLTVGSIRAKNAKSILQKNILDAAFGALGWYVAGWAFAWGDDSNHFIGSNQFVLTQLGSVFSPG